MKNNIGFIQGRLSPIVDGKIQAFPVDNWESELELASKNSFKFIEWTLDHENIKENPYLTEEGQKQIQSLKKALGLEIPSLTGDFFMQAPFYKELNRKEELLDELSTVIKSCAANETTYLVIPLVDNSSVSSESEEDMLANELENMIPLLEETRVKVVFESDFAPEELKRFISRFDSRYFGINYDTGNSASLGFDPKEEFEAYGERILNIHIKDRLLGGTTVPLGTGNADFNSIFSMIKKTEYSGNLILQTARAEDGKHLEALISYKDFVENHLE